MRRLIEPLTGQHDVGDFKCGNDWLDKYLQRMALANQKAGYGRTYVAIPQDGSSKKPHGYYTISMSSIAFANLPQGLRYKSMPKYPMPAAHLGCLAVDEQHKRQGLGSILLIDALSRMVSAADLIAARVVEVKAIDDFSRKWYRGYGFVEFADLSGPPYHMYLPMETARQIVAAAQP